MEFCLSEGVSAYFVFVWEMSLHFRSTGFFSLGGLSAWDSRISAVFSTERGFRINPGGFLVCLL